MHPGPTKPSTYTVGTVRTILFEAPGGMVASAIQRKFTDQGKVTKRLQDMLDERCDMDSCWTRIYFPTVDKYYNETGHYKLRYFIN
jgi:hypothetical protein